MPPSVATNRQPDGGVIHSKYMSIRTKPEHHGVIPDVDDLHACHDVADANDVAVDYRHTAAIAVT